MTYSRSIDGLRGIAVLLVIFYHLNFYSDNFNFGFIGVDIFFVISGYLITNIIIKDQKKKQFNFKNYFERRFRRLFPALLFVSIFVLIFSHLYILPEAYKNIAKSINFSLLGISNLFFFSEDIIYGNEIGLLRPLLHTWSTSIEIQFYIIFGIFFPILLNFISKKKVSIFFIIVVILNLLFLQLSGNFKLTFPFFEKNFEFFSKSIFFDFYFINSRLWEFLIGSLISINKIKIKIKYKKYIPFFGLLLILISFIFIENEKNYPNLLTVMPVIGTAIFLITHNEENFINKLLKNKILIFIGLISYSLYLWHYPIISLNRIVFSDNINNKLLSLIIIFLLSLLTYKFIEIPGRNKKFKSAPIIISSSIIILFFLNINIINNNGYDKRFAQIGNKYKNFEIDNKKLANDVLDYLKKNKKSSFSSNENKKNVLILGDSHALDLFMIFNQNLDLFPEYDFSVHEIFNKKKINYDVINKDNVLIENSDIIIISIRWIYRFGENFDQIQNFFEVLSKNLNQKKILITSNSNEYYSNNYLTLIDREIIQNYFFRNKIIDLNALKTTYYENRLISSQSKINLYLMEISKKKKFNFFYKENYLCDLVKKECDYLTQNGSKIFLDSSHLTVDGAKFLGKKINKYDFFKEF